MKAEAERGPPQNQHGYGRGGYSNHGGSRGGYNGVSVAAVLFL